MEDDRLRVVAKRPNEAAKMFAMYLLHAGVLCEYSKGSKPVVITVSTANLLVNFKAPVTENFRRLHRRAPL